MRQPHDLPDVVKRDQNDWYCDACDTPFDYTAFKYAGEQCPGCADADDHGRSLDRHLADRRTGGAGSRTQPLSDADYRREMDKLHRLEAADARRREEE